MSPIVCMGLTMVVLGQVGAREGNVMKGLCPSPGIEQMLAANPGKTPISLLQEYGTRIGKTPCTTFSKPRVNPPA